MSCNKKPQPGSLEDWALSDSKSDVLAQNETERDAESDDDSFIT
jgi:hypothetical protein